MDLGGKTLLVVGGSSGIGLATARLAASEGARVTIASRDQAKITRALTGLAGAEGVTLDLTDDEGLERFFC